MRTAGPANVAPLTDQERTALAKGYGSPDALALLYARQRAWDAWEDVERARAGVAWAAAQLTPHPAARVTAAVEVLCHWNDHRGMNRLSPDEGVQAAMVLRVREYQAKLEQAERALAEALAALHTLAAPVSKGGPR